MGELWGGMLRNHFVFGLCHFLLRKLQFTPIEKGDTLWLRLFGKVSFAAFALHQTKGAWHQQRNRAWNAGESGWVFCARTGVELFCAKASVLSNQS